MLNYKVALLSVFALLPVLAPAEVLVFQHEGRGSGTLDGQPFPASDFVIRAIGDTNDRESFSDGWLINHSSASIQIEGLGTFGLLSRTFTFVNNGTRTVGFSFGSPADVDLFDGPTDPAFATWDMLRPIGPISGMGELMQWNYELFHTTGGILFFDTNLATPAVFTAIPEPAGLALLGFTVILARRR